MNKVVTIFGKTIEESTKEELWENLENLHEQNSALYKRISEYELQTLDSLSETFVRENEPLWTMLKRWWRR